MSQFKFIHAADLHLDVPMRHVKHIPSLADITFKALDALILAAKKEKVDAILFSGDIWNSEDASLKARFAMQKACEALNKLNIKVFIAYGNHDPLEDDFQKLALPENVFFFKENYEAISFEKDGKEIAVIHGISHATSKESRNLTEFFPKLGVKDRKKAFQIAMLHTSLAGSPENKEDKGIYAPCSLSDLIKKNPHYWALGHVHSYQILNENPHIVYSGSLQGLHINEDKLHGAVCITMTRDDKTHDVKIKNKFLALAPLVWENIIYNFNEEEQEADNFEEITTNDILNLQNTLHEEVEKIIAEMPSSVQHVAIRLTLQGETKYNAKLRNSFVLQELLDNFNEQLALLTPACSIHKILIETEEKAKKYTIEELIKEDTFLAEALKEGEKLMSLNKDELLEEMYAIYLQSPIQKQFKKILPPIEDEERLKKIIKQALYICIQSMEEAKS